MKNIMIVPNAKIVNLELQSRYGKITPINIPLNDKIILDYLYEKYSNFYDEIVIVGYEDFEKVSNIVGTRNYSKIKLIKLDELKDIGYSIYFALKNYSLSEIKSLSINFADTLINNLKTEYLNRNIIFFNEVNESEKWTTFTIEKEDIKINDKIEQINNKYNAFVGFFNFINSELFFKILEKNMGNSESLYLAIKDFYKKEKINFIKNNDWLDFGHLDNYFSGKNIVETRYFNHIDIDKSRGILFKSSEEKEKFINEIKWFLKLPEDLQWVTPRIYSYSLNWEKPFVKMEYYSYPTLHHMYLYGNYSINKWEQIFEHLLEIQKEFSKYKLEDSKEKIKEALNKIYLEKTIQRLLELKKDINFSKYIENDYKINAKECMSLMKITNILPTLIDKFKIYEIKNLQIIHGDYFFANILYEPNYNIVKLIDPRGDFGGYGIYGDKYYELAKLSHSVDGMYDFIVEDMFELEEKELDFNYTIKCENKYFLIKDVFYKNFNNEERIKIKFIQALLFLSMLPLHKDKPKRQKIMLGVGMRLLNEVINGEDFSGSAR